MTELKIKNNVPLSNSEKPRQRWPFHKMTVDSVVDVKDKEIWPMAQKYAHYVATTNKWKIHAKWLKKENIGRIRRVK